MDPSNSVVKRFVAALNAGDNQAFFEVVTLGPRLNGRAGLCFGPKKLAPGGLPIAQR